MSSVEQSLLEIKKILSGLWNELSSVNAKMDDAKKSSISSFDAVKKEIDLVKSDIKYVNLEIESVKSEIKSIKTDVLEAEERSKARSDGVKVQLMDMEYRTASKIDGVKSVIGDNRRFVNAKFSKLEKTALIRFDNLSKMIISTRESIDLLKGNMASTNEETSTRKSDLLSTEEMVVDEMTTVRHSIESMRADAESTTRALRAVEGEMTATSNSMRNVETAFVYRTEKFDSSKSECESLKTSIESFVSRGISSLKEQLSKVEEKVTYVTESLSRESSSLKAGILEAKDEITKEIVSIATSNNAAMDEEKASTSSVTQRLEGIILDNVNQLSGEMSASKLAIGQQSSILSQLQSDSMETKVVNKDISEEINQSVLESHSARRQHLPVQSSMILMQVNKNLPDFLRNVCVESLLAKTVIHGNDGSKLSIVRSKYERLYSRSPLVSILMKFLLFHPKVRVHVDFGSHYIGRMKKKIIDFDGEKNKGSDLSTFPILEEESVYMGGDGTEVFFIAFLAQSLLTLCCHLLYQNGGLPFKKDGDPETEKNWDEMLQEAEGKVVRGGVMGYFIHALYKKTRKGKLIAMISNVPYTIAYHGSLEGILTLTECLPSALDLYHQQVIPDLTRDWEVSEANMSH